MAPAHQRIYQWLLVLYPEEFRAEYSRELAMTFEDCWRAAPAPGSRIGVALRAAAGVLTEAPKEHWHMFLHDVRHGLRLLRKDFPFTVTALALLAIGIGATTTIFSVLNALFLRPLPYPDAQALVYVEEAVPHRNEFLGMAFPNYQDLSARNHVFTGMTVYREATTTLTGQGDAERVQAGFVTHTAFAVLGIAPQRGRTFTPDEDRPNARRVVLVGDGLWKRRYGADPNLIGRNILLGEEPAEVIGIMPRGFHFPDTAELWLPLQLDSKRATRNDYFLEAIARLKPGVTQQQADAEMKSLLRQIVAENPTGNGGQIARVRPLQESWIGDFRKPVLILGGAVAFVLLIACVNMTNLLLARAPTRLREMAIRGALGASRARMVRQLLIESVLLGIGGAALGIAVALAGVPMLASLVSIEIPAWMRFDVDGGLLAFAIVTGLATSMVFGIAPAILAARQDVVSVLKDGARGMSGGSRRRAIRTLLVTAEIALSLALLAGAGLMLRTFEALRNQPLGFQPDHVLTVQLSPPPKTYQDKLRIRSLIRQVRTETAAIPGVIAAAAASTAPLNGTWGRSITAEGHPVLSVAEAPVGNLTVVTPGYFSTLGIRMIEGRDFTAQDGISDLLIIVDKGIAEKYWPHQSALGKRIRLGPPEANEPWHTIIGVCDVVRNQQVDLVRRQSVYVPHNEISLSGMTLVIRTSGSPMSVNGAVRERLRAIDRNIAVSRVWTLDHVIVRALWQRRFITVLLAMFAGVALLLAAVGVYGVLAESVAQRTHELGIRMALGATATALRAAVLMDGLRLVALGGAAGALLTFALTRVLGTLLYNVTPTDAASIGGAVVVMMAAATLASYIPARRATAVNPLVALRHE